MTETSFLWKVFLSIKKSHFFSYCTKYKYKKWMFRLCVLWDYINSGSVEVCNPEFTIILITPCLHHLYGPKTQKKTFNTIHSDTIIRTILQSIQTCICTNHSYIRKTTYQDMGKRTSLRCVRHLDLHLSWHGIPEISDHQRKHQWWSRYHKPTRLSEPPG